MKRLSLIGQHFSRLTIIEYAGVDKRQNSLYLCYCDCGMHLIVVGYSLRNGHTKSCGCLRKEISSKTGSKYSRELGFKNKIHGDTSNGKCTKEYRAWSNMKNRCYNPNYPQIEYYGSRGITVCDRWLHSFENFLIDMGRAPSPKHSIDRINNDLGYSPDNCRWATSMQQRHNRRN